MTKLLKFLTIKQRRPAVTAPALRAKDFEEIYARFDPVAAAEQASRCSQCGIPFCQVHCPLQNNIPDWLMLTAAGRLE
ncbi:MAG: NAD(P)-dependent oxidoreductase, partial [Rickettsiales bacterium]